ncbi:MAG: FAD-dependent oxidoreductase, partial [Ferruginibacter sp.]|nr:FAD-dependent oxidoreductase [Ferruginibacter sp.]
EVLTVKAPGSHVDYILKRSGIYLVPTGGQGFKAGATYQWGNSSEEPDLTGRATIEATIGKLVTAAYEVTKHESGIRPTTKNREVIIAQHQLHKNMFMFNGLGTKGVLNAPWFAGKLLQQYFKPSFPGENNAAS